jgi:hypothetical protein
MRAEKDSQSIAAPLPMAVGPVSSEAVSLPAWVVKIRSVLRFILCALLIDDLFSLEIS